MANLLQSGVASAERVFELLDADEQVPDRRAVPRGLPDDAAGEVRFEHVSFSYDPERPLIERPVAGRRARPDRRDRRPDRCGQDHAGQPGDAVLRARRAAGSPSTGSTSPRCRARRCARQIGMVLQDTWLFAGTHPRQHRLRPPRRHRGGDPRGRAGHVRRPVRALAARRLRHPRSTRRAPTSRRGAAAGHDRPGVPVRPGAADPRRGDLLGRHPHRAAAAARDGGAAHGPDVVRDRPPALDDPRRRPDPGDGGRRDRRAGHPRRAARRATAPTPGSTRRSSPPRSRPDPWPVDKSG